MTPRLGRRDLRPGRRPVGPLGRGRSSTGCRWPATERSSTPAAGSGRVTELLAERLPGRRASSPSMTVGGDDRRGTPAARPGSATRIDYVVADLGRPLPLDRARRRDPVDRDVPLGARPRRAVPQPRRGHAARGQARRPVRRRRQRRQHPGGPRHDRRRLARAAGFATPGATRVAARGGRLRRRRDVAPARTDAASSPASRSRRSCRTVVLGAHVAAPARGRAGRLRPRGREPAGDARRSTTSGSTSTGA